MSRDWQRDDGPPAQRAYSSSLPPVDDRLVNKMVAYLINRGLSFALSQENGWYPSSQAGDHAARIVIPATSGNRANRFWQARAMDGNPKRYQSPSAPRGDAIILVNPPKEPVGPLAASTEDHWLIVEGPLDALAAAALGYHSIAWMGTEPNNFSLGLTRKLIRGKILTMLADRDAIGSMSRFMGHLASLTRAARLLVPPVPWKDLAEMPYDARKHLLGEDDGLVGVTA